MTATDIKQADEAIKPPRTSVGVLGWIGDPGAQQFLFKLLKHEGSYIRTAAAHALTKCGWKPENKKEKAWFLVAMQYWNEASSLGLDLVEPLVNVLDEDAWIIGKLAKSKLIDMGLPAAEAITALPEKERAKHKVSIDEVLQKIYDSIKTVTFGEMDFPGKIHNLDNPDVSNLKYALSDLEHIYIQTASCNQQRIEDFITYAVNEIGQDELKSRVDVFIYGDSERLNRNLKNLLNTLFEKVHYY